MKEAFVYKTTNLINGKIYVGVRTIQGYVADDKYLGSGLAIKASILKYGRGNFLREIISYGTQLECYELEELIVDEWFIRQEDNYNLSLGGVITRLIDWTDIDPLLGTMADHLVADRFGREKRSIAKRRNLLGILSQKSTNALARREHGRRNDSASKRQTGDGL